MILFFKCACVFYVCVYILCVYMVGGGRGGTGSKSLEWRNYGWLLSFFIFQVVYNKHKLPLIWGDGWMDIGRQPHAQDALLLEPSWLSSLSFLAMLCICRDSNSALLESQPVSNPSISQLCPQTRQSACPPASLLLQSRGTAPFSTSPFSSLFELGLQRFHNSTFQGLTIFS